VENAGAVPVLLPTVADRSIISRYLGIVDGLILSGGVDIDPALYHESPHPVLGEIDRARDAAEIALVREALDEDVPMFAICRGIQILNVAMGGTLYQDLPSQHPSPVVHRQDEAGFARSEFIHDISIEAGSRLRAIVRGDAMPTNSLHHQAVREVADGLVVTARAPDGVVEAAEVPDRRYVLAVQFHPEETAPHDERSRRLFEAFVAAL
jgi:putative glutamine amidotransferase